MGDPSVRNASIRKLENINDTSRLKILNKLAKMTQNEKYDYNDNIMKMPTYTKDDVDTQAKRDNIYVKLFYSLINVTPNNFRDMSIKLEEIGETERLKVLNRMYDLDNANKTKEIQKILRK
jgi:hypothetical protein